MPYRVHEGTIINQFSDTIPKAAAYAEHYLRLVAQGIQEAEPPVTLALDIISSGGFRAEQMQALIVEPTEKRLRHYKTCHFATPHGGLLNVGWYLIGGDRAGGRQMGYLGTVGAATDMDVNKVMSIVEVVQTYAVQPAMQQIADLALGRGSQQQGFFGV